MLGIMLDAISDDFLTALDDSDVDSDLSDLFRGRGRPDQFTF